MKSKFLVLFIFPLLLVSCFEGNKGISERYEIVYSNEEVDKESLDAYFLRNDELYPNYQTLKSNQPDLLNRVKKIKMNFKTVEVLKFSYDDNGGFDGMSLLHYDNDYYPLGASFGGYGLTEFIIRSGNLGQWFYFIGSAGSGIHQTFIGVFNISHKEYYTIDGLELEAFKDYTFVIDDDKTIDLYEADINQNYSEEDGFYTYQISKKDLAFANIDDLTKSKINS